MKRKKLRRIAGSLSPHHILKRLSGERIYNDIARRYGLVYFGSVSAHDDDYEMVRGFTVSTEHQDRHYCVGTVEGFDVILLERTDNLTFPGKPVEIQKWIILQVDLRNVRLPHIFLDNKQHSALFYDALFAKFSRFSAVDVNVFADHDSRFVQNFTVHSTPSDQLEMIHILRHEMTATLGHHFTAFDFELFDDRIIVYSSNHAPSKQLVDNMLRAGVWLAREVESKT